jgi:hypothetical protein
MFSPNLYHPFSFSHAKIERYKRVHWIVLPHRFLAKQKIMGTPIVRLFVAQKQFSLNDEQLIGRLLTGDACA